MNCETCKTRECEYAELEKFLQYISEAYGKNFEICECPDKNNADYTCDLVVMDHASQEKIYIEIKEVKFGFEGKHSFHEAIAQNNGKMRYFECISSVLAQIEDEKMDQLNDFTIHIPKEHMSSKEWEEYFRQMKDFINRTSFQEDVYKFVYQRKNGPITFLFERKSEETRNKFGDNLVFAIEPEKDNTIKDYFDRLADMDTLEQLLHQNAQNTGMKKFPQTKDRKILLNILKLPEGNDVFFERIAERMFEQLADRTRQFVSGADEIYLLYFSENFIKTTYENDSVTAKPLGKALFVIPLTDGLIQDGIVYYNICN